MTFRTALSGLNAAAADLNVTSHNIANVATVGFKGSRAEFSEVFATSTFGLSRTAIGSGVRTAAIAQQFSQGSIEFTENGLDIAISGGGFFRLSDNGAAVYSRAGNFQADRDGFVVNPAGHRVQVFPPIAGTNTFDTGRLQDLQVAIGDAAPQATTDIGLGLNLPANATPPVNATFDPTDPRSYNHTTSLTVYDSLGAAHVATLYFVRTATENEWQAYAYVDGNAVGGPNTVTYSETGTLVNPAGGTLTLPTYDPMNGAADLDITLDLASSTQYGDAFSVSELSQNGFTTGRLTGIETSPTGVVFARFTNGQSQPLGQLVLASFANPQGLQELGDNVWGESFESGQPLLGTAGSGSFGLTQSGALEASNVDLTAQLVNMITAQRNFQANAQMISTQDQVTQTVINIR
ncbi:flagellar hook protein FlgE [Pseudomarimonas salicorniae]|uniref:Flagellar hook protein FlgE n=1 Tax=Pseudomarimonas salicorniae TaxID=2933270 RepID=A0ABT0GL59_9GAMM|nr:flagellar hook protein FlgE [Lysobacter sp. CAU 1642]MCK7595168.1 flagellar hook protein FlgE [Lysobacter sp. CAU 1642]